MDDNVEGSDIERLDFDDDDEFLYYDFTQGREFDDDTKRLIDQIAHDPRFGWGPDSESVAKEWVGDIDSEQFASIETAAYGVYKATVGAELETRAAVLIDRAFVDPDFDALPPWDGEEASDDFFAKAVSSDPRLHAEVGYQLTQHPGFIRRREAARRDVEVQAGRIADELPQVTRDALVLMTRNAAREELLRERIGAVTSRRLGWTAYYVQRTVREREESGVLDRYSAAAKMLAAQGNSKAKIARLLAVSSARVERFLVRSTWRKLEDTDPLLASVPELRAAGDPVDVQAAGVVGTPRSFSRMNIAEREALAEVTTDPAVLGRLVAQGSRRISEAFLRRHVRDGDLDDDLLRAILTHYPSPWMRDEFKAAHALRPLPERTALELAVGEPQTLIDADDETANQARLLADERYPAMLALRNADVDGLIQALQLGEDAPAFQLLLQMFVERSLPEPLMRSPRFVGALISASERASSAEVVAALRLVACQDADVLATHVRTAVSTGSAGIDPQALVSVALGSYHRSSEQTRGSLREVAAKLWKAADLTVEHSLARAVVADRGTDRVVVRTKANLYVATPDAIRSYANTDTTSYTYVHLHLTAASEYHFADGVLRMPTSLPALGYHREIGRHPSRADGDDVPVIVWPLPLQPAIYSLDTSLSSVAAHIAVADGKVARIKDLE